MYRQKYQGSFFSLLYSLGSKPLSLWKPSLSNGYLKRVLDDDIKSFVFELRGRNSSTTYLTCPENHGSELGIKLPVINLIIKNLGSAFFFEIQVKDSQNIKRRLKACNFQSMTNIEIFGCTMPLTLNKGWNRIQLDLEHYMKNAFKTQFKEIIRVTIHASCRIRRVYFTDKVYSEDDTPFDFKLFIPNPCK